MCSSDKTIKMKAPTKPSRVSVVKIHSRKLQVLATTEKPQDVEHSIVWVKPVEGDTPESVAAYVDKVKKLGAARALALPLMSEASAVAMSDADDISLNFNVTEIVEELLQKVTELKDEVCKIVRGALARAKL